MSPPPLFARHQPVAAAPEGDVTVSLLFGIGGAGLSTGLGLELRAAYQATADLSIGLGIGGGRGGGDDLPREATSTGIYALRLFGRANAADWSVFSGGVGLLHTSSGLTAVTVDAGGAIGDALGDVFEPSLGVQAALSMPLLQGDPYQVHGESILPTTTFYIGGNLGLGFHIEDNYVSGEFGAYAAFATGGTTASVFNLSLGDLQGITP